MRRLHCASCTCADVWTHERVDVTAPFYGLVIEIDRLSLREQRDRYRQTLAERHDEGEPA